MRNAVLLAAGLLLAPGLLGPAMAAFNLCNKTKAVVRVALGHFDGQSWTSEGWWSVAPTQCATLLSGPLQARYYYFYATDGAGSWEGKTSFCVLPNKRFKAEGRADCARRGFDRRGFSEVDTGKNADWTQTLSN
jgi:uncharacterized membrane protein